MSKSFYIFASSINATYFALKVQMLFSLSANKFIIHVNLVYELRLKYTTTTNRV